MIPQTPSEPERLIRCRRGFLDSEFIPATPEFLTQRYDRGTFHKSNLTESEAFKVAQQQGAIFYTYCDGALHPEDTDRSGTYVEFYTPKAARAA